MIALALFDCCISLSGEPLYYGKIELNDTKLPNWRAFLVYRGRPLRRLVGVHSYRVEESVVVDLPLSSLISLLPRLLLKAGTFDHHTMQNDIPFSSPRSKVLCSSHRRFISDNVGVSFVSPQDPLSFLLTGLAQLRDARDLASVACLIAARCPIIRRVARRTQTRPNVPTRGGARHRSTPTRRPLFAGP